MTVSAHWPRRCRSAILVQEITAKTAHPSLDWLNFIATPTARKRIHQWYEKSHRDENIARDTGRWSKSWAAMGSMPCCMAKPWPMWHAVAT